jgi:hypothetical protein
VASPGTWMKCRSINPGEYVLPVICGKTQDFKDPYESSCYGNKLILP